VASMEKTLFSRATLHDVSRLKMHIGPYATQPATVERMRAFALENGYRDCVEFGGKHHEIYLGDRRKADPAKFKTVLRHPVERA
jgi:hypothetical protein